MIAPIHRLASSFLQYGIAMHFRHSRPMRRHTCPSPGGPMPPFRRRGGGPQRTALPAIPAHSRAWRPPPHDREEALPRPVTERADTLVRKLFFCAAWTEPPERACVSLPRHDAVFGG